MSEPPVLRLNPALDPAVFAQDYARDGWVRAPEAFEPQVADRLAGLLEEAVAWSETATHLAYPMALALADGQDQGHPIHAVTRFLGASFPAFVQGVVGHPVALVEVEARLYRPADGRGLDARPGVGFAFDLTRWWQPDWGGQILFHDAQGDIARGFAPVFASLVLFDASRSHSIAPVAPAAERPRLAIEGLLA